MGVKIPKLDIKKLKPKGISFQGFKFKKKPSKKMIIIGITLILVVAFIIVKLVIPKPAPEIKHTVLSKGKVINSVNVLGEVKSQTTTNIYSTLNNPVKEVKVKIGDNVKAGDVLAILDSADLEKDIEQTTASVNAAEANAKIKLSDAEKVYNDELRLYNSNSNAELKNAEEAANLSKINLDDKKKTYENNKALFEVDAISKSDLNKSEIDFETANSDYEKAVVSLQNAEVKATQALNAAKSNYETASNDFNNNSQRIALEKQKQQLENCKVKANVDGTITAVNVVVGSSGNGILFKIENLDDMEVTASIKEVDIVNVKVGERAEIKTDGTGEDVVPGEVISVSPAAKKGSDSQSQAASTQSGGTSSDATFEAKIKINDVNANIKSGMSARVNIITNEKLDIYAVSSESIIQNNESKSIYIAEKIDGKSNQYIVKELPVNTGVESDFNVEISGEGISDGIIVIDDPSTCKVGDKVQVNER